MSQTLTKKGLRGFTLIELLVVIAIIGLLSTIIAAPIQNARKKAKDAKKVAELQATTLALEQYAENNNGNYPTTLAALAPIYMPVLSTFATVSAPARDRFSYVTYTGTPNGSTVSQVFGYHLASHLDVYSDILTNDRDCSGGIAGVVLTAPNCVFYNSTAAPVVSYTNYAAQMICGDSSNTVGSTIPAGTCTAGGAADLGVLHEGATSTCTNVNDCVYDVSNQQ
jgi:prepilin-type N-terminal cleavage/methylation domain-containing protein